ncbi:MAG: peptidase S8 [Candidatus Auribacter fodinae]|uniref:Peptidase S8 n=1 Tax=Candidatus Auribacter fodinae TaxID=2093366 RepID=A0A3A4R1B9_9BACT|nr:MAG: peptidase S8 [Candidatus Auribacter fodinae]
MPDKRYPHIFLPNIQENRPYSPPPKGGGKGINIPPRHRIPHSKFLAKKFREAWDYAVNEDIAYHLSRHGVYLEFKGEEGFDLVTKSLEAMRDKDRTKWIRLLNVREENATKYATVFVPKEKENHFLKYIEDYANPAKNIPKSDNPKHKDLINSISDIRKARFEKSFWNDDKKLIPGGTPEWCEVWLSQDTKEVLKRFEQLLDTNGIPHKKGHIRFPEIIIKDVYVNRDHLELITRESDDIAEYRRAKSTASFFTKLSPKEQAEWVEDLLSRTKINPDSQVAVLILDTGVNNGHPLLQPLLRDEDCQAVDPAWGTHDHHGHGTLMAGVIAYDDLKRCLESSLAIDIGHTLESVKILPPGGKNLEELWGDITAQSISLAEIKRPNKQRVICMAVSAQDTRDKGRPSSWSGMVDSLASGAQDGVSRLILLCAGNNEFYLGNYPNEQLTDSIHDPAQSWNALTVGAFTELDTLSDPDLNGYHPVAPKGGLSPFSTTSLLWEDRWPIKPEIMMEGGNTATDDNGFTTECDDLSLLSIHFHPNQQLFFPFNMTSAATAKAAWFAAQIQVKYPDFWPETIRALMVHSAEWTEQMQRQFLNGTAKGDYRELIRTCGYGMPDLDRALYSASNSLTLIAQAEIQPYKKDDQVPVKTKDMHFYELPWPKDILLSLPPDTEVEMRITLSYFIKPGPGEKGWKDRYRYPSHLLRFALNSSGEEKSKFIKRINQAAREEDEEKIGTKSPTDKWVLGQKQRDKGSIHSDIWRGYATDLATSNMIAIYPISGWWKERAYLQEYNNTTRYSLVVSIRTPETYIEQGISIPQAIDIYTPVVNQIKIKPQISI